MKELQKLQEMFEQGVANIGYSNFDIDKDCNMIKFGDCATIEVINNEYEVTLYRLGKRSSLVPEVTKTKAYASEAVALVVGYIVQESIKELLA